MVVVTREVFKSQGATCATPPALMTTRLLVVQTHFIQYFAPLYRELARRPGIDLTVAYATDLGMREGFDVQFGQRVKWDVSLTDGYHWVVMPEHPGVDSVPGGLRRRNWSVRKLVAGADAVLLSSFLSVTDQVAAWTAWRRRKALLYRSESTLLPPRGGWLREAARTLLLRRLYAGVSAFVYVGEQARVQLRHYGVPEDRLHFGPYAVGNDLFTARARELAPHREALRARFGLEPAMPVILFSGKLIPKKQPLLLLEAFARLQLTLPSQLLIVGDGELRPELERRIAEARIPRVHLAGFFNQSRIGEGYVAADLLVLPSAYDETWGLVMNEAMCFGLPVVASDRVGGAIDLVREGETGATFRFDDVDGLVEAMRRVLAVEDLRRMMGDAARKRVGSYSIQASADGIVTALDAALGEHSSPDGQVK
jgi:glycosyltransferase involved in cell wall biosynthesis